MGGQSEHVRQGEEQIRLFYCLPYRCVYLLAAKVTSQCRSRLPSAARSLPGPARPRVER